MSDVAKHRATTVKPALPLDEYAGVYNDAWYGPATIRMEKDQLVFTLDHTPRAVADLQPWQYDTFKAHFRDRTIEERFRNLHPKSSRPRRSLHNGCRLPPGRLQLRTTRPLLHPTETQMSASYRALVVGALVVGASLKRAQAAGPHPSLVAAQPACSRQACCARRAPCRCSARLPKRASFLPGTYFITIPE